MVELFVPFPCTGDGDSRVLVGGLDFLVALSGSRYAGLHGERDPQFVLGYHGAREPLRLFVAPVDVSFGGGGVVALCAGKMGRLSNGAAGLRLNRCLGLFWGWPVCFAAWRWNIPITGIGRYGRFTGIVSGGIGKRELAG